MPVVPKPRRPGVWRRGLFRQGEGHQPGDLAVELLADRVFFETSGGGVTFSGGEPLAQAEGLVQTARLLRAQGVSVAVETALEVPRAQLELVLNEVDLILADLKAARPEDHQAWTGRGNERVLGNFKVLADYAAQHGRPRVVARTPLIPGYTATETNLRSLGNFLKPWFPGLTWELLDFNPLARAKYRSLGRTDYPFAHLSTGLPEPELRRLTAAAGLPLERQPQEVSPS